MHVERKNLKPTEVSLTISATTEDLEPVRRHVLGHFIKSVKVPGFRPGKAPLALVEKNVDQKAFADEFIEHALNELYRRALEQERLRPIGSPRVELKKFVPFTLLEFDAVVEVIGDVALPNYKAMKLTKKPVSVTTKDVNEVVDNLRQRMAERKKVERPAKKDDEVTIDFSGKDSEGKAIPNTDGKDYPLVIGSGSFIPGFEENVEGMKVGESKDFDVTFPEDYGVADMQGKKVTFSVTAKKIAELEEPKADDTFAAKAGPFKSLADLKADVKKQLANDRQAQADRDYENELIQKITEKSSVEIPDSVVVQQLERLEEDEKKNLVYQGQTWQEHLKAEDITEEQHRERHKPEAEMRVKAGIILSEIADKENITVEPEELDIRLQMLKGQHQDPAMLAELDKPENQQDVAARLLTEKTIAKLVDYASKK